MLWWKKTHKRMLITLYLFFLFFGEEKHIPLPEDYTYIPVKNDTPTLKEKREQDLCSAPKVTDLERMLLREWREDR